MVGKLIAAALVVKLVALVGLVGTLAVLALGMVALFTYESL